MVPQACNIEEWNHPRCWSVPSRYRSAIPSAEPSGAVTQYTKAWVDPLSNHTSRISNTWFIFLRFVRGHPARIFSLNPCTYQTSAPSSLKRRGAPAHSPPRSRKRKVGIGRFCAHVGHETGERDTPCPLARSAPNPAALRSSNAAGCGRFAGVHVTSWLMELSARIRIVSP